MQLQVRNCKKKYPYHGNRYRGLNLHSLLNIGTIELRYHSGTLDSTKIINWLFINTAIIDYCNKHQWRELEIAFRLDPLQFVFLCIDKSKFSIEQQTMLKEYIQKRMRKFAIGSTDTSIEN